MFYNHKRESFEYFSDFTIPYRYLETVARKYVITYFCKDIFIVMETELNEARVKHEEIILEKKLEQQIQKLNQKEKKPLFVKLKSYNSNKTKNTSQNLILKENSNRYTYKGKFANYNILKKIDRKMVDKKYAVSYREFKNL